MDLLNRAGVAIAQVEGVLDTWAGPAFEGLGAGVGERVILIPTVKNENNQDRTFLVVIIFGEVGFLGAWTTEPTMPKSSYPGGMDAAVTGEFEFAPKEERECPMELTIPEDVKRKTYDTWIMVFHGTTKLVEKKFHDVFSVA